MTVIPERVRRAYEGRARWYDSIVRLLSLGHDTEYRRRSVSALRLKPGDRVLDVGCGTGLNFRWMAREVGPEGLLVGTDACLGMLRRVAGGVRRLQATAAQDVFRPASFDAAICTYVISTTLEEQLIGTAARALRPGGRLVIVDDSLPPGWYVGPCFMVEGLARRGWPDLRRATLRALEADFRDVRTAFFHLGLIWMISAVRR